MEIEIKFEENTYKLDLTAQQKEIMQGVVCPYCKSKSQLISSVEIYGKDFGMLHMCVPCGAYVGCHKNTTLSKGRLANKKLRQLKKDAHYFFDKIWNLKTFTRGEAYEYRNVRRIDVQKNNLFLKAAFE